MRVLAFNQSFPDTEEYVEVMLNETWRLYTPGVIHLVATAAGYAGVKRPGARQVDL